MDRASRDRIPPPRGVRCLRRSLQWIVAPVHERIAPLGVLLVVPRAALGGVALRVADDLAHVVVVDVAEVVLLVAHGLCATRVAPRFGAFGITQCGAGARG